MDGWGEWPWFLPLHDLTRAFPPHEYNSTNDACLAELKRRWVAAGQPDKPDWARLLDGL